MSNYYDDDNDYDDVEESCDEYSDGGDDDGDELEDCGGVIDGDEIESKENDGEDEINENIESGEIDENDDYDDDNNNNNEDDENNDGEDNDSDEDYYNFKMNEIKSSKIIQPTLEISKQQSSSTITPITKNTKKKIKSEIPSSSSSSSSSSPSPLPAAPLPQLHQNQQSTIEANYRHKLNWDAIEKRAIYNYIIPQTRIYKQMSRGVPAVASKMLVNLFKVKSFKSAYIIPEINRNECFYNRTSNNAYNKK
jgi:hypothetical protein